MLLTAFIFFLILSILVFVHELGHFTVAKWVGVKVEEFGFGLPPKIWGKQIGETIYSINWLPIGGFVKLAGEDEEPSAVSRQPSAKTKHLFWSRSKKERAAILLAGVTMNLVLAIGITTFLLTQGVNEPVGRIHIVRVLPGSPAEQVGLQKDDIIVSGAYLLTTKEPTKFTTPADLITFVKAHAGRVVVLDVIRSGGEPFTVQVTPRTNPPPGEGALGVAISDLEKRIYPLPQAPFVAVKINLFRVKEMVVGLVTMVGRILRLQSLQGDVAGPIGIAQITGEAVKIGWQAVLEFMSILSLNLAVINILPIPALDGGRLAFVFAEKLIGRRIRPAFERSAHQIGMIILLTLVVLISLNDILRLARGG